MTFRTVSTSFTAVGPTHTRGDTVFFVEEDRVLFAGDVVMNSSFLAAGASTSMRAWLVAFRSPRFAEARRRRTVAWRGRRRLG